MIDSMIKKYANLLTALCIVAAAYAAPYLVPGDPDALVFRDGIFPAILLLVTAYPVSAALKKHALSHSLSVLRVVPAALGDAIGDAAALAVAVNGLAQQ